MFSLQFLLEMLLEDTNNNIRSTSDWGFLASSTVTTLTRVLAGQLSTTRDNTMATRDNTMTTCDNTMTTQCCEMLISLLTALQATAVGPYSLLGSSVTGLLRVLSKMTSPVTSQVRSIVKLLLADCQSPELLPIVEFGEPVLDALYAKCAARPLLSKVTSEEGAHSLILYVLRFSLDSAFLPDSVFQDLLTTVRSVEGAYWYLSNMTSLFNMTSPSELTIQNTAVYTLLKSDDSEARALLGRLDNIAELDISLINTIDVLGRQYKPATCCAAKNKK